jgi:hypothetical protein
VENRTDNLSATDRVHPAVAVPFEHDRRAVIGIDRSAEIRPECSIVTPTRVVRSAKSPADGPLTPPFRDIEMLFPLPT